MEEPTTELTEKRDRLIDILADCGKVAVAFSAGVDSTVVAKAAQLACGENAIAVTAVSPSLAEGEREASSHLAGLIGIRHRFITTEEFGDDNYTRNASNRCYFCKSELYEQLERRLHEFDCDVIVNGANTDDRGDHRPGMTAAHEHRVRSPLMEANISKREVRELARSWDLPVWDKPASPCLSSRVAYGVSVTPERVARIDAAERFLRDQFGLRELRVRHEANDLARIEVPSEAIPALLKPDASQQISKQLHALGFKYVTIDLDGFRSGSMNDVLPIESLQTIRR